jgi:hypothetical protein
MYNKNPIMKLSRILSLIVLVALAASCSKDDEPEPRVEDAALSFSKNSPVIEVPQALITNEDSYAQMAAGWISMANGMTANLAMFTPPAGAERSTNLITPVNGRVSASSGVVYTWSDGQGNSVAYQVRDESDKYIFELFYKGQDDSGWYRYLYAQEAKDRSAGYMRLYDVWGVYGDNREAELLRWDWTRKGDQFTLRLSEEQGLIEVVLVVNTKTRAGSVTYFESSNKLFEMTWDAQGKGSWKSYDAGELVDEGTWE